MKISTFSFVSLGPVNGPSSGSFREREESIHRIQLAHRTLIEVRFNIVQLSDIKWSGDFPYFKVERGIYYDAVRDAITKGLVWCTDSQHVDYPASVASWKSSMQTGLSKELQNKIELNDLSLSQFEEFKVMYTLYLISATRSGAMLVRHPDFSLD